MKTLGVITTTFNRGYCIHQVYNSLLTQDSKDFMWLIIDDGSTDNTKDIINRFISEGKIEIKYIWQQNKGMHCARNLAYDNIKTEINLIIDSDDWMADGSVKKIIDFWNANKKENIAGIISLNADPNGKILGGKLPENINTLTVTDMHDKLKMKGDKKLIYRSDLSVRYPYPEFEGEKYFPASYKFRLLDLDYKMLAFNEVVCNVDFNENSATFGRISQYKTCAKGFAFYRNEMIRISKNPQFIIRETIHYIANSILAGNKNFLQDSAKRFYTILLLPVGFTFYHFLKNTKRKSLRFK